MSCTTNLTHLCLLSAVNLWRSFQGKNNLREARRINFFIRNWWIGYNWLKSGIQVPMTKESGIQYLGSGNPEFAAWHPESTLSYHHPYSHLTTIHEDFKFKRKFLWDILWDIRFKPVNFFQSQWYKLKTVDIFNFSARKPGREIIFILDLTEFPQQN